LTTFNPNQYSIKYQKVINPACKDYIFLILFF
jgi:hypothetical protein